MSWRATAWAAKQETGSSSRKLTLFALANYADEEGICWPSQEALATDTEQSIDTVQRNTKRLQQDGFIDRKRRPKLRGQWPGILYQLRMRERGSEAPLATLHPRPVPYGHTARRPSAEPQHLRHYPSQNPSSEPFSTKSKASHEIRLSAWQANHLSPEIFEDAIAKRLGTFLGEHGWLSIGTLTEHDPKLLRKLIKLQRTGHLADSHIAEAAIAVRQARRSRG